MYTCLNINNGDFKKLLLMQLIVYYVNIRIKCCTMSYFQEVYFGIKFHGFCYSSLMCKEMK